MVPKARPPQSSKAPQTAHASQGARGKLSLKTTYYQKPPSRLRRVLLAILGLIGLAIGLTHYAVTQASTLTSFQLAQSISPTLSDFLQQRYPQPHLMPWLEQGHLPSNSSSPLIEDSRTVMRSHFGHLPYRAPDPDRLIVIGSYSQRVDQRFEQLHQEAGLALMQMVDAARSAGVWLVPVSGFRDFDRQQELFESQAELVGSQEAAAHSVAPPGYSEHHTGYAIDLADGLARAKDLSLAFGQTEAYQWLTQHAQEFGFELSFPENNTQGVMYEPWHWRFVRSPNATRVFSLARGVQTFQANSPLNP